MKWVGTPPTKCDLCHTDLHGTYVDGKTIAGPWAIMCGICHANIGCGLGTGRGQLYLLSTGKKIEG
jgi:hypothetical protein